jgi:hypothetical protein
MLQSVIVITVAIAACLAPSLALAPTPAVVRTLESVCETVPHARSHAITPFTAMLAR